MIHIDVFNKMCDSHILSEFLNENHLQLREVATHYCGFINFKIDTKVKPRKINGKRNNPYLGRIDSIDKTNDKYDIWINSESIINADSIILQIIEELKAHDFSWESL